MTGGGGLFGGSFRGGSMIGEDEELSAGKDDFLVCSTNLLISFKLVMEESKLIQYLQQKDKTKNENKENIQKGKPNKIRGSNG